MPSWGQDPSNPVFPVYYYSEKDLFSLTPTLHAPSSTLRPPGCAQSLKMSVRMVHLCWVIHLAAFGSFSELALRHNTIWVWSSTWCPFGMHSELDVNAKNFNHTFHELIFT